LGLREINTVILSIVSEMEQAGIAHEAGYPRFNLLLSDLTRINPPRGRAVDPPCRCGR
jgi:hypothetical protein